MKFCVNRGFDWTPPTPSESTPDLQKYCSAGILLKSKQDSYRPNRNPSGPITIQYKFNFYNTLGLFSWWQIDDIFIFPENRIWHFLQNVSIRDNLHRMSKPVYWEK